MRQNAEAMMRLRARWKAAGLCSRCGGERKNKYLKTCGPCRATRTAEPAIQPCATELRQAS